LVWFFQKSLVLGLVFDLVWFQTFSSTIYSLAMFLDPRFKHSFAPTKDIFISHVELWIAEKIKQADEMEPKAIEINQSTVDYFQFYL
jgi:hypothetical protein